MAGASVREMARARPEPTAGGVEIRAQPGWRSEEFSERSGGQGWPEQASARWHGPAPSPQRAASAGGGGGDFLDGPHDLVFGVLGRDEEPNPGGRFTDGRIEDRPGVDAPLEQMLGDRQRPL
jgi:hypothetical protein